MKRLEGCIRSVTNKTCAIAMGLLSILCVLDVSDVLGRYLLNKPIRGSYEGSEVLLVGVIFLGVAYTLSVNGHVTVSILVSHLRPRLQAILGFLTSGIGLVISSLIVWQSAEFALRTWENHMVVDVIGLPLLPFCLLVSVGMFMFCLELIIQMLHFFTAARVV